MKLVFLSVSIFLGSFSFAQNKKSDLASETMAQLMTTWMRPNLILNSSQEKLVYSISLRFASKIMEWEQSDLSKQQLVIAHRADGQSMERELKSVLTAEQFQLYLTRKESMLKDLDTYLRRLGIDL